MSKLEELGGLKEAKKYYQQRTNDLGLNLVVTLGDTFGQALIERVEELERKLIANESRIESMYIQWNRADSQLQAARELADATFKALDSSLALVVAWACHWAMQGCHTRQDYKDATEPKGWNPVHRKIYEQIVKVKADARDLLKMLEPQAPESMPPAGDPRR